MAAMSTRPARSGSKWKRPPGSVAIDVDDPSAPESSTSAPATGPAVDQFMTRPSIAPRAAAGSTSALAATSASGRASGGWTAAVGGGGEQRQDERHLALGLHDQRSSCDRIHVAQRGAARGDRQRRHPAAAPAGRGAHPLAQALEPFLDAPPDG